jgi:hypothetical protein
MLDIILLIKRFEAIFWPFGNIYHLTPTPSLEGATILKKSKCMSRIYLEMLWRWEIINLFVHA